MFALPNHRSIGLLALTAVAALAIGCGSTQPTVRPTSNPSSTPAPTTAPTNPPTSNPTISPTSQPSATPGAATLLLEVTTEGGFISPTAHLGQLPSVVVDTAGNIYTQDLSSTDASLIPQAVVRNVGTDGAAQILAAIRAAGLDKENGSGGGVSNPDAGVTVFTVDVDGQEVVTRVVDNGAPGPGHPGGSPSPATNLLNKLLDPDEKWGAADVQSNVFKPTAYKVYSAFVSDVVASLAYGWPLTGSLADFGTPATPDFGVTGLRTGAVAGDDAVRLAAAFDSAGPDSLAISDGGTYQVWIRPLLPPELS